MHLTTHSAYSLQEGLALPSELAWAAAAAGMPALGLTDHRLLGGSVEFAKACKETGVQPLLGLEIDLENGPLALLAMNLAGWANLCRLSSALAMRDAPASTSATPSWPGQDRAGTGEAACPLDLLEAYSGDLIALRGNRGEGIGERGQGKRNETEEWLCNLKGIFADRLYVALQEPGSSVALALLAHKLRLHTVVTHPVYYLTPEQAPLQRTLAAIRLNQPLDQLPEHAVAPQGAYFVSQSEMESRYPHFPVALEATQEIAARCKFDLPLGVAHMPTVPLPPGLTAAEFLRHKAE